MLKENIQLANKQREGYQQAGLAARDQVATASAMTDLMNRVRMGWGADSVQQGARILSSLGVSDANVQLFTGTDPSAGDALNKLFLQMSAGAVRQMGAREPGSVISLFSKAYPNLATNPHAAELMANALQMQARFKVDMANAADQWLLDQQKNMGQLGQNYRGLLGFEQAFAKEHSPRDYWRAAAAMSNEPDIAWKGASDAEKHQIYALIPPGSVYRAGDGKLYRKAGGE